MTTLKRGTLAAVTVVSSGGSIASGSNAISAAQDPTAAAYGGSGTTPGYEFGVFVLQGTAGGTVSANSAYRIYFRRPVDGTLTGSVTTWENDQGRSTSPLQPIATTRLADPGTTAQNLVFPACELPATPFEVILENGGTGQALSSGWSLTVIPQTDVGV